MSESDLSRQFSDLREVAARLNEQSDSITKTIEQFQDTLQQLNLGLEVWIRLQSEESVYTPPIGVKIPIPVSTETSVGYARGEDGWALYVKRISYRANTFDNPLIASRRVEAVKVNKWMKLVDASRSVRIAALDAFPKLLDALKTSAESAVQAIENAKKFLS